MKLVLGPLIPSTHQRLSSLESAEFRITATLQQVAQIRLSVLHLRIISMMLTPQVGDRAIPRVTNGGHFPRSFLKLRMPFVKGQQTRLHWFWVLDIVRIW